MGQALMANGIVRSKAPPTPGTLKLLGDRLAFIRWTFYQGDIFDVRADRNPVNEAYTSTDFPSHTDQPYHSSPPGITITHCIEPAQTGGESTYVDGYAAAEEMRRRYPQGYRVLADTLVQFVDRYACYRAEQPIIEESQGVIMAVHVNNSTRD